MSNKSNEVLFRITTKGWPDVSDFLSGFAEVLIEKDLFRHDLLGSDDHLVETSELSVRREEMLFGRIRGELIDVLKTALAKHVASRSEIRVLGDELIVE